MAKTLSDASYVLLGTLRKNGNMVETPVWFAQQGEDYYMYSEAHAGKVKRLRNFSTASLTPCTVLGKPLGEKHAAEAWLLSDAADIDAAYQALRARYGWQMRAIDLVSKLAGKIDKRAFIRARLK